MGLSARQTGTGSPCASSVVPILPIARASHRRISFILEPAELPQ